MSQEQKISDVIYFYLSHGVLAYNKRKKERKKERSDVKKLKRNMKVIITNTSSVSVKSNEIARFLTWL